MNFKKQLFNTLLLLICINPLFASDDHGHDDHQEEAETHHSLGPNGGELFHDKNIELEVKRFESNQMVEFRVWAYEDEKIITDQHDLTLSLLRMGNQSESVVMQKNGDYWTSHLTIGKPHSFDVFMNLNFRDKIYSWQFDSYEGRVHISEDLSKISGIVIKKSSSAQLTESMALYGKTVNDSSQISHVRARFPGALVSVKVDIGDQVNSGDVLAYVESNESLKRYPIKAMMDGVVIERHANPGEMALEQTLFTVANFEKIWIEFQIFPGQLNKVKVDQSVTIAADNNQVVSRISHILPGKEHKPYAIARVLIDNPDNLWTTGVMVSGKVTINTTEVPLAVENTAIQTINDEAVVFINEGQSYEARPVMLGRSDDKMTVILSGLSANQMYVAENSYLIKADIEKSGASHSH